MRSHRSLRSNRKALICDVSCLVKKAKEIENAIQGGAAIEVDHIALDDLIMKAFKTVTRAVKFLDIWAEDILLPRRADGRVDNREVFQDNGRASLKPSARFSLSGTAGDCLQERLDGASVATHHNQPANNRIDDPSNTQEQTIVRPSFDRSSHTYVRPSISSSTQPGRRPSTAQHRLSVTHRISRNPGKATQPDSSFASVKLSTAHDLFLGSLGSFIGLHLESRSSTELLSTTKQAVLSCRDMLKVVGVIWERDGQLSRSLADAREDMYNNITDLAEAARLIFQPTMSDEAAEIDVLRAQRPMVNAATACVRAAGDCVAESQCVLERLGDFSFQPLDFDSSHFTGSDPSGLCSQGIVESDPEVQPQSVDENPPPQEPTNDPPPPPLKPDAGLSLTIPTVAHNLSPPEEFRVDHIMSTTNLDVQPLLPPLPPFAGLLSPSDDVPPSPQLSVGSFSESHGAQDGRLRTDSFGVSSATGCSTLIGSVRDSELSELSETSTRATSPDASYVTQSATSTQCESLAQSRSTLNDEVEEAEFFVQQKTFAHEIVYNKEGQISGGTLPALVERLTTHDSTPDQTFVATFFLTFRLFATPRDFAQALIDRFSYVADNPRTSGPVRLRVYNIFKGWLESHWRNDCDNPALDLIVPFATRQLQVVLPTAGKRLACLTDKVIAVEGPLVPRLVSSIGKTNTSIANYIPPDTPLPAPVITKSQLTGLKNWKHGGASISIMDFDPLELARQFTIKASAIFCSILPEELLATEWMKKSGSMAVNVRAMSTLSTDLANLVADCILQIQCPKKRAAIIKQWVKIAKQCLELANYDSLMAIICSLNSSTILRLKRTWQLVSAKTKASLEDLKAVVDCSRNYAVLRQRLQITVPPCLPFVGTYLTDLTFVDVGNQTTRQLQGEGGDNNLAVINFDKHVKTAKIISDLQRFQIPYRFAEVPELQTWMQDQLVRVRSSDASNVQNYYRRSLLLEPREQTLHKPPSIDTQAGPISKDKFEMFWWPHAKTNAQWAPTTNPS